jgi:hypothetical protein
MTFGRWYPLENAPEMTPARAGVLQLRVADGLIDYPRGKSAMIHYTWAPDMRQRARELADAHPGRPWLCRHSETLATAEAADIGAAFDRLVASFRVRFGAEPTFPR